MGLCALAGCEQAALRHPSAHVWRETGSRRAGQAGVVERPGSGIASINSSDNGRPGRRMRASVSGGPRGRCRRDGYASKLFTRRPDQRPDRPGVRGPALDARFATAAPQTHCDESRRHDDGVGHSVSRSGLGAWRNLVHRVGPVSSVSPYSAEQIQPHGASVSNTCCKHARRSTARRTGCGTKPINMLEHCSTNAGGGDFVRFVGARRRFRQNMARI